MLASFLILLLAAATTSATTGDYQRLTPDCPSCAELDQLLQRHSAELSPDRRLKLALSVAKVIARARLNGKTTVDQKRQIFFAINAALQVQPDDFDSETAVRLLDLRAQSPANFDQVLWRFTRGQQQSLIERMRAFKDDKLRPNAVIPVIKELE